MIMVMFTQQPKYIVYSTRKTLLSISRNIEATVMFWISLYLSIFLLKRTNVRRVLIDWHRSEVLTST